MAWFRNPRAARGAAEIGAELESQGRQLADRSAAVDLLKRWSERFCNEEGPFPSPEEPHGLCFREILLKSHAFEALLDSCAKSPAVCSALRPESLRFLEGSPSQASEPLVEALAAAAELLLLPGCQAMWPRLLEALIFGGAGNACARVTAERPRGALRWEQWARKVLAALKKPWQAENVQRLMRHLDTRAVDVVRRHPDVESGSSSQALLSGAAGLSKQGIRTALARERYGRWATYARDLETQVELLCLACQRLRSLAEFNAARVPKMDRLVLDAAEAVNSLTAGAQALTAEQESLGASLDRLSGDLNRQLATLGLTALSLEEQRSALREEREKLQKQLRDLESQLRQLDTQLSECSRQETHVKDQLSKTTAHFESKINALLKELVSLSEEKLRAVAYQECAHVALDVVQKDFHQNAPPLREVLRKRRGMLQQSLASYIRAQRLCFAAAADCAPGSQVDGSMKEELRNAFASLRRVRQEAAEALEAPAEEACDDPLLAPAAHTQARSSFPESVAAEVSLEDEFACCVECSSSPAEWATISYGCHLCTDCAGRHRGLGVHLSFVRSLTMDRWTPEQRSRMQLGGNERWLKFLRGYPGLSTTAESSLPARYASKAASYYRRWLDAQCSGSPFSEEPPGAAEGVEPAASNIAAAEEAEEGATTLSLEEEEAALSEAAAKCRSLYGLDDAL